MGPSLCRMLRRAADAAGTSRRIFAVSRFRAADTANDLQAHGVTVVPCDLAEPAAWAALPDAPNVVFMAGQKFGTGGDPARTWYTNIILPALAASRYREARIVAFSTGNVYAMVPVQGGGSREGDTPAPIGEYAQSCLGRERVFEYAASQWGTRVALLRLNYAVDLRYGVLVDLALRIRAGVPVDLTMGFVNCIWQGDANAMAIAALRDASSPARCFNLTGSATLRVRDVAQQLGEALGIAPAFTGSEGGDALLSNASQVHARYGPALVPEATLIAWVAQWIARGLPTSGKPTHFEQREGRF